MTILETLQEATLDAISDYEAKFSSNSSVPKHRQLDVIKLREIIKVADDANELRQDLKSYSDKLISSFWWWVPFTGSRLGYGLKDVLGRSCFTEKNILIEQLSESRSANTTVTYQVNKRWEKRLEELEENCQSISVKLQKNQTEIKRLRHENQYLLATLKSVQADKTQYEKELEKLRKIVDILRRDKTNAQNEIAALRLENQRLKDLIARSGIDSSGKAKVLTTSASPVVDGGISGRVMVR